MEIEYTPFTCQKYGNAEEESDDAFEPRDPRVVRQSEFRCAVADGATEGYQSGEWARCLADSYCRNGWRNHSLILKDARDSWDKWLTSYLERRKEGGRPLAFYEEAKLQRGAHSTLLGLTIRTSGLDPDAAQWCASAVGDTCLFHVRRDELTAAFPFALSSSFDSSPPLISNGVRRQAKVKLKRGRLLRHDFLFVASDAVAQWFLKAREDGEKPWKAWLDFGARDNGTFQHWVTERRSAGDLRNDDCTLLRIEIE